MSAEFGGWLTFARSVTFGAGSPGGKAKGAAAAPAHTGEGAGVLRVSNGP